MEIKNNSLITRLTLMLAVLSVSASIFAAPSYVPTETDLSSAGYNVSSNVVICLYFDEAVCNDIVLAGSYNSWSTDPSNCVKFSSLSGYDGWWVVSVPYTSSLQAKPVQLDNEGNFSWDYQSGDVDAWIQKEGSQSANIKAGYSNEADVTFPKAGAYIYEIAYFKSHNSPCVYVPTHKYTIKLYPPECGDFKPAISGSFNDWATPSTAMKEGIDSNQKTVFTYEISDEEGHEFKFREANDDTGNWLNQFQYFDEETQKWSVFDNFVLPKATKDTTLVFDFSDTEKYRYAQCSIDKAVYNVLITLTVPDGYPAAGIEVVGSFEGWGEYPVLMENVGGNVFTATVQSSEEKEFKFREYGTWDNEIITISDSLGLPNMQFGDVWTDANEGKSITLDYSDSEIYAWKIGENQDLVHVITIAEFLMRADTETTYELTGVVKNITNTTYGNFYLVDGNDSIYIYGLLTLTGEKKQFASLGIKEGDTLTVQGIYYLYNDVKPEIVDAQYIKHSTKADVITEPENIPTTAYISSLYDTNDNVVIAFFFDEEVCNDIVLTGSFNNWSSDLSNCLKFSSLPGFDDWWVVSLPYSENLQAKPLQLESDGTFAWTYQAGDESAWINCGDEDAKTADISAGYDNEATVKYPSAGAYIYEIAYFKRHNSPCTSSAKNTYEITFYHPNCRTHFIPAISGDFNDWKKQEMNHYLVDGNDVYYNTCTITDKPGHAFRFCEITDSENLNQIEKFNETEQVWEPVGDIFLPEGASTQKLVYDFSDITKYRFALCEGEDIEIAVTVKVPKGAPDEGVEIAGTFGEWRLNPVLMTNQGNDIYTANVTARAVDLFKFRQKGTWDNEIITLADSVQLPNLVFGDYLVEQDGKYAIDLDFSDPTIYAWEKSSSYQSISIADFIERADTITNYMLTGTVQNIKNTVYGNFDLVDGTDSISIYGLLTPNGEKKQFQSLGIEEGDIITLYGSYTFYQNTKHEIVDAVYVCRWRSLSLDVNDEEMGSVVGAGEYKENTSVEISAVANEDFQFKQWSDGNTDNPRSIVLDQNMALTAYFETVNCVIVSGILWNNGDKQMWTLSCDSVLTISGEGEMENYYYTTKAPWNEYKENIKFVIIKDRITNIGNRTFTDCSNLISVTIGNSVTSIGESAFSGCGSLTSITIPNSVTSIGALAFLDCSSLTSIKIPDSVTSIGDYAFGWCSGFASIEIPNSVTSVGEGAFADCSSLTSVTIGNSVTSIVNHTFSKCSSLTSIKIPNSVTSIGDYAFGWCSVLASIEIPNSVTSIGEGAFTDCSGLKSVTIGSSVTSIGNYTFSNCNILTSIKIPNSVTSIGEYAFSWCFSLASAEISNSVISIGDYVFYDCISLTSIDIPDGVTSIGVQVFSGCDSLTYVKIPNSVTSIGEGAFSGCRSLSSITLPCNISTIGSYAFDPSLTNLTILNENCPNVELPTNTITETALYVPADAVENYKAHEVWGKYKYIYADYYGLDAYSDNEKYGKVIFSQSPSCSNDFTAKFDAQPNDGYEFVKWSDGVIDSNRTIVLDKDTNLIAFFESLTDCSTLNSVKTIPITLDPIYIVEKADGSFLNTYSYIISQINSQVDIWNADEANSPIIEQPTIEDIISNNSFTLTDACGNVMSVPILFDQRSLIRDTTYALGCIASISADTTSIPLQTISYDSIHVNITNAYKSVIMPEVENIKIEYNNGEYLYDNANLFIENFIATWNVVPENEPIVSHSWDEPVNKTCQLTIQTQCGNEYNSVYPVVSQACTPYITNLEESICFGETGVFKDTLTTIDGCDSIIITTVTLKEHTPYLFFAIPAQDYQGQVTVITAPSCENNNTVVIRADEATGYEFLSWNDGSNDNPRTIQLTENTILIANFKLADQWVQSYNVTVMPNDASLGYVRAEVTVTAVPYSGAKFLHWDDGSQENPRTMFLNEDITLLATFGHDQVTQESSAMGGNISIDGNNLNISGYENEDMAIYSIVGQMIYFGKVQPSIHIEQQGVYLVRIADKVVKVQL